MTSVRARRLGLLLVVLLRRGQGYVARTDSDQQFAKSCASSDWLKRFNQTQSTILNGNHQAFRAVVIRPHGLVGLGNRLNAIRAGFYLAVTTNSLLALDYSEPMATRLRPRLVRWDMSEWPTEIAERLQVQKLTNSLLLRNPKSAQHFARTYPQPRALSKYSYIILDGWNNDLLTTRIAQLAPAWAIPGHHGRSIDLACTAAALFQSSSDFDHELKSILASVLQGDHSNSLAAAFHLRTNREFADQSYVSKRLASRRLRRPQATHEESCNKVSCWLATATRFHACAQALITATKSKLHSHWLLASDDHNFVTEVKNHFAQVLPNKVFVALPKSVRMHSGLLRSRNSSLAASSNGPLIDLMLVASASVFIGTAGSSFSTHAMSFGGHIFPPSTPPFSAVLFRTAFVKGPPAQDPSAWDLPHSDQEASQLCSSSTSHSDANF